MNKEILFSAFVAIVFTLSATATASDRPDVLVIMADDLGYQDVGFHGAPVVKTPHLDALAASGIVFTDAHTAASVCSPSRAGFITGRYQQRFGHEANVPPHGQGMDTSEYTMGQAFQGLGYKSFLVGKWHLGNTQEMHPNGRGFDDFYGLREGSRRYFCKPDEKFGPHSIERNGEHVKFEGFLTDRMTDAAIEMIDSTDDEPYFMFLSYTAPHGPLEATEADLAKAGGNPYHALIQNMDDNIGRLFAYLKEAGRYDNTIVWFLSDNGGTVRQASNRPLNGKKGIKFEGGHRTPFVLSWPARIKEGSRFEGLTSAMDIFPTSYALVGGTAEMPRPLDGVNLASYLDDETEGHPHDVLYWRKLEGKAIRDGDWKLIVTDGLPPMLYDLDDDLSERENLAEQKPEIVDGLIQQLEAWESELMQPLWQEGKKWIDVRKKDYIRFRDATDFIEL